MLIPVSVSIPLPACARILPDDMPSRVIIKDKPGPVTLKVFCRPLMAPVVNVMVEHESWVRSIVLPFAAAATALRRLPVPLSAQLKADST
jgi:hypothetical protein